MDTDHNFAMDHLLLNTNKIIYRCADLNYYNKIIPSLDKECQIFSDRLNDCRMSFALSLID